ncbi:TetR/AcrR family transcriptional regulator [Gloeobacter morelensis]|uniref:TetR/AcrR family transcriptional regulator n=1 Tax=Gloeobacter morelensis MG652769 TaxID=2781736 RepID=A0ABY3PGF7_9CYAN|nr:TetR/AcrR family transcriptional regulator [Gloeobacter morelensis]UFP92637.1 TetR/AcrR family transcriptional regulator [Gloeobacter morelensis MG652769]
MTTRERILQSGLDLLSESGLAGVTLGVLAQQAGVSKSGLFAHFHSKEELQIALLDRMAEVSAAQVIQPALRAAEGLPRLKALVEHWLGWTTKAGLRGGCPVAAATFELDDAEGEVRAKVVAMEAYWRNLLTNLVRRSVELGHLDSKLDIEQFVWELCGIYLSHHASSRLLRDNRADYRALTAFDALVSRSLPAKRFAVVRPQKRLR